MFSFRTPLDLFEFGERRSPSAGFQAPELPAPIIMTAPAPHPLHGTGHAHYQGPAINIDAGTGFSFSGTADLGKLGAFKITGSVQGVGFAFNGHATGELVLTNKHGSITLTLHGRTQSAFSPVPGELIYSISKATGDYLHTSGYGTLGLKMNPAPIAFGHGPSGQLQLQFH